MTFVFGYDPPVILWPQFLRCVKAPYSYNPALNDTHTHKQTEPAATPGPHSVSHVLVPHIEEQTRSVSWSDVGKVTKPCCVCLILVFV